MVFITGGMQILFAEQKRIIVGLGNPGSTYKGTRHNVGFETIDKLCYDFNIDMKNNRRFRALTGEGRISGVRVMLVQPQTYMNLSGEAISKILAYYRLTPLDMVVVYDDVSLPVGAIRVRERGSSGGQKGMINTIALLGTDEFPRVRIGIGDKPPGFSLSDYVLSRFLQEEWEDMIKGITKAGDAVQVILKDGVARAMTLFNEKVKKSGGNQDADEKHD